jgi:RNA polymerase sigma-70 factor (ECF subfamily)
MTHVTPLMDATAEFTAHRAMIFGVAYNLLGSVADTEDVLQETWLSWASARRDTVANPRAYLARTAVNNALARLKRRRQEGYAGPWLPEPLLTAVPAGTADPAEAADRSESLSLAVLTVLERLSPLERAVFVLDDVFGYSHIEIADIISRSPAAVRQLAHRARENVRSGHSRYQAPPTVQRRATERFITAALGGDLSALMEVLAPGVSMWSDDNGKLGAARRVISGRGKVLRLISAAAARVPAGATVRYPRVNGEPAALLVVGGRPYALTVVQLRSPDDDICGIYSVINPGKLAGLAAAC